MLTHAEESMPGGPAYVYGFRYLFTPRLPPTATIRWVASAILVELSGIATEPFDAVKENCPTNSENERLLTYTSGQSGVPPYISCAANASTPDV